MSMLVLLAILIGGVLGMRFKVLILVPAIGLALITTLVVGAAHGDRASSILIGAVSASICLQIGYIFGLLTRYSTELTRAAHMRRVTLRTKSAK